MAEDMKHDWQVTSKPVSHQEAQDWINGKHDGKIPADVSAIQGSLVDNYTKFIVFKDLARTGTHRYVMRTSRAPVDFKVLTEAMNCGLIGTLGFNKDKKAFWMVWQEKDEANIKKEFPGLLAD